MSQDIISPKPWPPGLVERRIGSRDGSLEPVFSPDGRLVVYVRYGEYGTELIQRSVQTEDERTLALPTVEGFYPTDWSPDGSTVLLSATSSGLSGSFDIWAYSIEAESGETLLASEANERDGVFSPDGSLLAYASDESGRYNVYVRPISGSGVASRVSLTGGRWPEWRQDGNELFFMRPDGMIMAVAFGGDESFSEPTELFQVAVRSTDDYDLFDVAPDGECFLVLEQTNPQPPLILVQNWPALLDR